MERTRGMGGDMMERREDEEEEVVLVGWKGKRENHTFLEKEVAEPSRRRRSWDRSQTALSNRHLLVLLHNSKAQDVHSPRTLPDRLP